MSKLKRNWDSLNIRDKASIIKIMMPHYASNIEDVRDIYNNIYFKESPFPYNIFEEGGTIKNSYKVKKGDSFWKIAQQQGVDFNKLIEANPSYKDPNLIYVGDEIILPDYKSTSINQQNQLGKTTQSKVENTSSINDIDNIGSTTRHYAYSGDEKNSFYGKGPVNIIDAPGGVRHLSREELAKFNKLTGNNIKYRSDDGSRAGGTYAYLGDNGTIKYIGSSPLNPSTSEPAEISNWGTRTFYNIASLSSLYNPKTHTYDLSVLDPETKKGFEKAQKETGYNPETAYFALNKYLSEKGDQIPEKWKKEFNITDKYIKYLQTVSENPHTPTYLYNFNPDYRKTADVIDHDIPVNAVRGLRALLAARTKGMSELGIQGISAGLNLLGNSANKEKTKSVFTGLSGAVNDTDPAVNWVVNPIIKFTNDNNLGVAAGAGATAALNGKGTLGKAISGIGTAGSVGLGNYLTSTGYENIGDIVSNYGFSLFNIIGSGGTSLLKSSGANAARQAINVGTRAALNAAEYAGLRYLVGLGAEAADLEGAQKEDLIVLATNGISTGLGKFRHIDPSVPVFGTLAKYSNMAQNYINTISPGSGIVNTAYTRSGGRPDASSATANINMDNPYAPYKLPWIFNTDRKWYAKHPKIKTGVEALTIVPNELYQVGRSVIEKAKYGHSAASDYLPQTYNGITVNSQQRRLTAPSTYTQYQNTKSLQFPDPENPNRRINTSGVNDFSVPENFRYTDYNGNEIRVPSSSEVSRQARIVRTSDADRSISFDTSVPLWSLAAGKIPLKKGQSVQYSNAKVSSTTLQEGDAFYNASDKGRNDVILVEPTTILDSSIATQVMAGGNPVRTPNSRYVRDELTKHGYTRYDEINMGNQNVDAQKSIGEINGTQVDMNLKGCITKVSVYSKPNSSDRNKDVIVLTDSDLASPGSAREHYTAGNNERDIARTRASLGLNNKRDYQNEFIKKDKYTVEEANQVLQEVYKDLNKRQKGILKEAEPIEVTGNQQGEVSVTKMRQYIGQYFDVAVGNITTSRSLSKEHRVNLNSQVRKAATSMSHRVITDLGSTSFTREEVKAKLGDPENPAKGTLRRNLDDLGKEVKKYDIKNLSEETRKKLADEGYKIFDANGNAFDGKVTITQKHAEEVGVNAEYNQKYDSQSKKLKALIAFGEGTDLRQALKK